MIGVSTNRIWNCPILSLRKFLLCYKKVLNTVLYNRKEGTNNVESSSNSLLSSMLLLSILRTCSSTARRVIATPNTASVNNLT